MNPCCRLEGLVILYILAALTACERTRTSPPGELTVPPGVETTKEQPQRQGAAPDAEGAPDQHAPSGVGTLVGRVIYRGPLPETTIMYIPDAGDLEAHTIIADASTRGLKNAVVWVEECPPRMPVATLPKVVVDQDNFTFVPHVLAVRAGQTVGFLNSDIANHNIHSFTPGNTFNLGFPLEAEVTYTFRKPTGSRPVRLECDIHDWMRAWVYVFRHDAFAVTDARGRFRIEGVPSGRRQLRVHHADGNLQTTREVVIEKEKEIRLDLELLGTTVPAASVDY